MNADRTHPAPVLVRCRTAPSNWLGVLVFGAFGAAMLSLPGMAPPTAADPVGARVIVIVIAAPLFLLAGVTAAWCLRAEIIADEDGLRWRGLARTRRAPWSGVTDYYERLSQGHRPTAWVETVSGKFLISGVTNAGALREIVQARPTGAPAHSWEILGTRPGDSWPRVFHHLTADTTTGLAACLLGIVGPPVYFAVYLAQNVAQVRGMLAELGPGMGCAFLACYALVALGFPLSMGLSLPLFLEGHRRRHERVVVDPRSLCLEDGTQRLEARWEEVTEVEVAPLRGLPGMVRIRLTRGRSIEYLQSIHEAGLLKAIITRYAGRGVKRSVLGESQEVLGGDAARWSGGSPGIGQRIYHYRTRANRAMLWFLSSLALLPLP